ncbi:MAG: AAA family ATPase [Candidatus Omnitrophica bacterium]|nr:AAA family ATPase [Candidatus Omnitrophota bacterium]
MYCDFFNLKERPFNVTADPSFFFSARHHKEALAHLIYGIKERKGVILITGEVGTGKTTLCRALLNILDDNTKTAFVINPSFSGNELLKAITGDFGIPVTKNTNLSYIWALNKFLINESGKGKNVVLVIDESQNLNPEDLELVRLLSNLETEKDKLLQIILIGQPELNALLDLHVLRQLKQRIAVHYHLNPMDKEETRQYILHRVKVASREKCVLAFDDGAVEMIYEFSRGVPRLINIACDRALLAAFNRSNPRIHPDLTKEAIKELQFIP